MYNIFVNGEKYSVEEDKKLIDFLREDLGIKSVKNGCKQGACGACSVLIDGKLHRSCVSKISRIDGKTVLTVEGLSEREKAVYKYAFAKTGAVQCGFCIPGMVIASKAILDRNLNPTHTDIMNGLKNNICRCTGYIKIEDAVKTAAQLFNDDLLLPIDEDLGRVGESTKRIDAQDKIIGKAKYVDDNVFKGMCYGKAIRLPCARAKLIAIDGSEALKLNGIIGIYTAKDIPGNRFLGHLQKDYPVMVAEGEETRFIGDSVALVLAESKELLETAVKLINIKYEELKPITNPFEAMEEGAYQIHKNGFLQFGKHYYPINNLLSYQELKRGDVNSAFKNAKYFSEHEFQLPFTEHAFMEPECAIAMPENGGVRVITSGQGVYDEHKEITEMLGLDDDKVRIQSAYVGGGFGGKEDMSVQHHAALMAYLSKRIVKVLFSRDESINVHPKRHAMWLKYKLGCDENGKLLGARIRIYSDTGAYASLGGPVLQRACTHAAGPYNFQNIDIEGRAYYTNNPPAGAFRGFGVTQSCFAMEACLNDLAMQVGIDGWQIRYLNGIRIDDVLPNGQIANEGTAFIETLEAVKKYYYEKIKNDSVFVGIASAMKNSGVGVGVPDIGRCHLAIKDGKVHVRSSAAAIGQGLQTMELQVVCYTTGLKPIDIVIDHPDTLLTPDSGTTTASRQTVFTGEACKVAAIKLKQALKNKELKDLEGEVFKGEYSFKSDPMGSKKANPLSHVAYGYATQVVVIDKDGKVEEVLAAHDIGKAINPINCEGQIEGGVVMAMGYALTEDFPLEKGIPKLKYGMLGLLRSNQVPKIKSILIEKNIADLAYGAKGLGEITTLPLVPALQNAYFLKDGIFRTKLPMEDTYYRKSKKR